MKSYDRLMTEGHDIKCRCCGYVYTEADGYCDPCDIWKEAMSDQIHAMAESLEDQDLVYFMEDGQAMAKALDTRQKWIDLFEDTAERLRNKIVVDSAILMVQTEPTHD